MSIATKYTPTPKTSIASALQRIDLPWALCSLLAAAVLAIAAFMPLWNMTLKAPQYPGGLQLEAYGTRLEGDLEEINTLNHYVGIRAIEPDSITELKLFPFAIGAILAALLTGAFFVRRRIYRLALGVLVLAVPLGMLVDLQWWLRSYGHQLSPDAPFRIDPFTPKVLGTTVVINFHSETMVAVGFWMMVAAAALLLVGPALLRFLHASWTNTGSASRTAAVAIAAVTLFGAAVLVPSEARAAEPVASIAEAIAAAEPGDTVVIGPGTYNGQLVIDRPVTLVGEGWPIIDGGGTGDVIRITAEGVTLRGFVIRNSAKDVMEEPAGIRVTADGATLEGNRIDDVLYGIAIEMSNGHTVRANTIASDLDLQAERRGHALAAWYSDGNLFEANVISDAKDGIFLGFVTNTHLRENTVTRVRYGLHTMYTHDLVLEGNRFRESLAGSSLMYSQRLTARNNEFSYNRSAASGYGLLFKDVDDVALVGNRIHHNRLGLTMEGAPATPGATVTLTGNLIGYNDIALEMFSTTGATFTENTFIGNLQQVEGRGGKLEGRNAWSLDGRGNYWDDYRGFDANGDGVGDLPYRYEGAFDDLVRKNDAVRAYSHTPARTALDLAARWFPVYEPQARVVDEHPLTSPTMTLRATASDGDRASGLVMGVVLAGAAALAFAIARNSFTRRWQPC